jgi:hypothetical protein
VTKLPNQKIRPKNQLSSKQAVIFGSAFAVAGAVILIATHAAGFTTSFEAENSTKSSPATAVSDASASGGSALKFAAAASGGSCALPNYPDASCTGVPAGTTLTNYTGPNPITTAGTVVDSKRITSCLEVAAGGVVIKNSYITCPNSITVNCSDQGTCGRSATPLTIQDSEIDCTGNGSTGIVGQGSAISEANFTLRRVNIHGCENGLDINQNVDIQDSYIHDLYNDPVVPPPDGAHADGMQFAADHWSGSAWVSGSLNVTIKHNTIYGMGWKSNGTGFDFGTSAIITNRGGDTNILIQDNLLAGGAVSLYCEQGAKGTNYRVITNHFSTKYGPNVGAFGPSTDCSDETQSGNVIHETGQPLTLP